MHFSELAFAVKVFFLYVLRVSNLLAVFLYSCDANASAIIIYLYSFCCFLVVILRILYFVYICFVCVVTEIIQYL